MPIEELEEQVLAFADARDWSQFHDPKNLIMALASEVGELSDLFRWVPNATADDAAREEPRRSALAAELGDVGILLLLLCRRTGFRLSDVVSRKLEQNERNYPIDGAKGHAERP